jgi:tetratricopeptide (TPR) repeat protein
LTARPAPGRNRQGAALFFEAFRTAHARAPAGLILPGPPAAAADIAAAEAALGRSLPDAYLAFLRSFDGADLFHESVVLAGVGKGAARQLVQANQPPLPATLAPDELIFAETSGGDRYALDRAEPARVLHLRAGSDERWLAGSSFPRWLEAVLAREAMLYDAEGEFVLEAFEPDGEELTPAFALRQAERSLRKDPGSAESHHDLGVALRRRGHLARAREHFVQATDLDPQNPWPWFDRGRTELSLGTPAAAALSFRRAAQLTPGAEGARLHVWSARAAAAAGQHDDAALARREAQARDPDVRTALQRAVDAAVEDDARAEAELLLEALAPRHRLPLLGEHPRRRP